jgi:alpha-tubulin suppressor-like RCC1 family protein
LVQYRLTVSKPATGSGTVTSSPAAINCGTTCAASFAAGTMVTMTAVADATSAFAGWSGACAGTGTCSVTMDAAKTVVATFSWRFTQISVDIDDHGCGVKTDGTLVCWGKNDEGQATPPPGVFTEVSAGFGNNYQTCGLKSDGTIVCWGNNTFTPPVGTFAQVSTPCAIKAADATVVCWGQPSPTGYFTQISVGVGITCGVRTNGFISCAGASDSACYGAWCPDCDGGGIFAQVSVGNSNTACGIKADGTVVCWGSNTLEVNNNNCSCYPNCSTTPEGVFTQISVGNTSACAIKSDATIICWRTAPRAFPPPPAGSFTQVSVGGSTACGIQAADATVVCWGGSYGSGSSPL